MEIVVFTNGCFDLLHRGHIDLLKKARSMGTKLIVGLNSDESVRAIKGSPRPFIEQTARAAILKELRSVDEVYIFDENTPEKLIKEIKPDILVKGGDWTCEQIVGADFVLQNGGKVISIPFETDISSTKIVEKIKSKENNSDRFQEKKTSAANLAEDSLKSYTEILDVFIKQEISNLAKCAELIFETLRKGKKILLCGDFENRQTSGDISTQLQALQERNSDRFPGSLIKKLNLSSRNSTEPGTSEEKLRQQIQKFAGKEDLLIAFCERENLQVMTGLMMNARRIECRTVVLTDSGSKKLISLGDAGISLPIKRKARLKTAHSLIGQIWCEIIEEKNKQ
jgi:rfaE bifunctional protein nucleotidyltransferase chain/domain